MSDFSEVNNSVYFNEKVALRTRLSTVLSAVKLHNLLHSDGVDIVLKMVETEIAKVEDRIDPKCVKCGTRQSVIRESGKSGHEYVHCIPMGDQEWMGYEHHQFRSEPEWKKLQAKRQRR